MVLPGLAEDPSSARGDKGALEAQQGESRACTRFPPPLAGDKGTLEAQQGPVDTAFA